MSLIQNNPLIIISEIGQAIDINNTKEINIYSEKIKNKESFIFDNNGELISDIENIFSNNNEIILITK